MIQHNNILWLWLWWPYHSHPNPKKGDYQNSDGNCTIRMLGVIPSGECPLLGWRQIHPSFYGGPALPGTYLVFWPQDVQTSRSKRVLMQQRWTLLDALGGSRNDPLHLNQSGFHDVSVLNWQTTLLEVETWHTCSKSISQLLGKWSQLSCWHIIE